jgi:hypothetical protein
MSGVPWFFDNECQAYKVRPGFKFPALQVSDSEPSGGPDPIVLVAKAKKMIVEGEQFLNSLRQLVACLEGSVTEP